MDDLLPNTIAGAEAGRCIYTPMCREDGGTVDDLLVYVLEDGRYLLVVNAANTDKDFQWIQEQLAVSGKKAFAENVSNAWVQLALQGPDAKNLLTPLAPSVDLFALEYYRHAGMTHAAVVPVLLSRTGYTGEDGFELYCSPADAPRLWKALDKSGSRSLRPRRTGHSPARSRPYRFTDTNSPTTSAPSKRASGCS